MHIVTSIQDRVYYSCMNIPHPPSWQALYQIESAKPYFISLKAQVENAYRDSVVYPPITHIFQALDHCPLETVRVVILGQDPYHGDGQAHGLAFSVPDGVTLPPSLKNIFKEIKADIGTPPPRSGDLTRWAEQGVLLLNTTLTVAADAPASHADWGWEQFTDAIIEAISNEREHIVFLLWGKHAQAKASLIDERKHLILTASHPSPLSAHRGFLGCRHFSLTNQYLRQHGTAPIMW